MLKLAVVGKDVSASKSPAMHAFLLGEMGKTCTYEKVSLSSSRFAEEAEALFSRYNAFNVTMPYKTAILPYLGTLGEDAVAAGSVNTVLCASRTGHNTDGGGFLLLLEDAEIAVKGKRVLLLGAGGAGRSCAVKLARAGAEVYVYGRNPARLAAVLEELRCFVPLTEIPPQKFDLAVNCTGVGMNETLGCLPEINYEGGRSGTAEELLARTRCAVDLIYEPKESAFLRAARELGKPAFNGEAMLFFQAYLSDCLFTGAAPNRGEAKALWRRYKEKYS